MEENQQRSIKELQNIRRCLVVLVVVTLFTVTYFARDLIMPVVLGFLLALTLSPVNRTLIRRGLPAAVSALVLVLIATGGISFVAYLVSEAVRSWSVESSEILREIEFKLQGVRETVDAVQSASEKVENLASGDTQTRPQEVVVQQPGLLRFAVTSAVGTMAIITVTVILAFFLLSTGDLFYVKLVQSFPTLRQKKQAVATVRGIERVVSGYLLTITIINAGLGLAVGTALWFLGLDYAHYWGIAAFALNFLPILGGMIGTFLVAAHALLHFDSAGYALLAPLAYFALTSTEGQVITPYVVGKRLELNVVVVFLTVVVWSWLWGIAGALIAVPMLIVFKAICSGIEGLQPIDIFLDGARGSKQDAVIADLD